MLFRSRNSRLALERKNAELKQIANYDTLTQLFNRYSMNTVLEHVHKVAVKYDKTFCVVLCDIDDFKAVNDTYGHPVGDQVLQEIASIFRNSIQAGDTVCRWGGEEFLFILNKPLNKVTEEIEVIRACVHKHVFYVKGSHFSVSMAFGVDVYRSGDLIEDMVKRADDKLYYGKQHGKNCVIVEIPQKEESYCEERV